jgi:hypothetical protein
MYGYEPIVDGEPCGLRITGEFYFYLNYGVIQKAWKDANGLVQEELIFPDFLAMDYYYFKELEARELPSLYGLSSNYKQPMVVAKSRRKGFSFKAAAGAVRLTCLPQKDKAKVLIVSDTGKDAALCFKKAMVIIDWLTMYTEFGREDIGDVKTNGGWKAIPVSSTEESGHFVFGIENTRNKLRRGRLTEISTIALTRADKISGEGVQRIYFEEAGKTPDLKKAWTFARESLKAGSLWKGNAIIFGTGGEMLASSGNKGHSKDFSELFTNPEAQQLAAYDNIYEYEDNKGGKKKCGYFVSDMWSNFGAELFVGGRKYEALDKHGNAYFWVAELCLNVERENAKKSGKLSDYEEYLTQRCKTPSEAFLTPTGSIFPVADLVARDAAIRMSRLGYEGIRVKGELIEINERIVFRPDLEGKLQALDEYIITDQNREGCLIRYEAPLTIDGRIPEGAYIISVDPIGQNTSSGKSLTSIIVMKTPQYESIMGNEKIVATYKGRKADNPQGYVHELLMKLSIYYNAKITFENDRDGGILQYFIRKGQLARLMSKPEMTLSKYIPNSKTLLREYGHSMASDRHKRIGEDLLLEWLLKRHKSKKLVGSDNDGNATVYDVVGKRNLDMLEDRAIIEELISYNREGNFDSAMALMGAIIQLNEHYNEDFIEREQYDRSEISSFLVDLYVNKYGTNEDKYKSNLKKANKKDRLGGKISTPDDYELYDS